MKRLLKNVPKSVWTAVLAATLPVGVIQAEHIRVNDSAVEDFINSEFFLEPQTTAAEFQNEYNSFLIENDLGIRQITLAEAGRLAAAYNARDWDAFVHEIEAIYGQAGLDLLEEAGLIFASSLAASPVSPSINVMDNTLRDTVFDTAKNAEEKRAEASAWAGMSPIFGGNGFYTRAKLDGGGGDDKIEMYGVNLGAGLRREKLQLRANLPIYQTDVQGNDFMTYGLDVAGKYNVWDNLWVGAHGYWLYHADSDSPVDYTLGGGPMLNYNFQLHERVSLSLGTLFDYIAPEDSEETWIGAFGANFGILVTENLAVNPYYVYFHDLDSPDFAVDDDWHDVGLELSLNLGQTWDLKIGGKTTLGYELFDHAYQVYLGTAWNF